MDRRGFLRSMIGGVAAASAVRTWPFRVFSFPSEVAVPAFEPLLAPGLATLPHLATVYYDKAALETLKNNLRFRSIVPFNGDDYYAIVHPKVFRNMQLFKYELGAG